MENKYYVESNKESNKDNSKWILNNMTPKWIRENMDLAWILQYMPSETLKETSSETISTSPSMQHH